MAEITEMQWKAWHPQFPHLDQATSKTLAPPSKAYNCIAWSLGFTDRWIDVGKTKDGLALVYAHYFHKACDTASATVDVFAKGEVPQHASKAAWSSKIGTSFVLQHAREGLNGGIYGSIYGHFHKDPSHPGNSSGQMPPPDHPENPKHEQPQPLPVGHHPPPPPINPVHPAPPTTLHGPPASSGPAHAAPHAPPATHAKPPPHPAPAPPPHSAPRSAPTSGPSSLNKIGHSGIQKKLMVPMKPFDPIPPPADAALATAQDLHSSLSQAFPPTVANFDKLYAAWKETWNSPEVQASSSSSDRAQGPAFDALVKLGPAVIPLVVHKLTDPNEVFAVKLYNALEKDVEAKIDPANILDHAVLQRHANLIVDMNHQRTTAFNTKAALWDDHQEENSFSSNSGDYTAGSAYNSMVKMGPGVIGHAMNAYANEPHGWWHEMLHEIVHGQKSGDGTYFKRNLHRSWREWFESGAPHEDAPKGAGVSPSV